MSDLPLHDVAIEFDFAYDCFEHNLDSFSHHEIVLIKYLNQFRDSLPPEDDDFWHERSLGNEQWESVRRTARDVLAVM